MDYSIIPSNFGDSRNISNEFIPFSPYTRFTSKRNLIRIEFLNLYNLLEKPSDLSRFIFKITLPINPEKISYEEEHSIAETQTVGGWVFTYWNKSPLKINFSGTTGLTFLKGKNILEFLYMISGKKYVELKNLGLFDIEKDNSLIRKIENLNKAGIPATQNFFNFINNNPDTQYYRSIKHKYNKQLDTAFDMLEAAADTLNLIGNVRDTVKDIWAKPEASSSGLDQFIKTAQKVGGTIGSTITTLKKGYTEKIHKAVKSFTENKLKGNLTIATSNPPVIEIIADLQSKDISRNIRIQIFSYSLTAQFQCKDSKNIQTSVNGTILAKDILEVNSQKRIPEFSIPFMGEFNGEMKENNIIEGEISNIKVNLGNINLDSMFSQSNNITINKEPINSAYVPAKSFPIVTAGTISKTSSKLYDSMPYNEMKDKIAQTGLGALLGISELNSDIMYGGRIMTVSKDFVYFLDDLEAINNHLFETTKDLYKENFKEEIVLQKNQYYAIITSLYGKIYNSYDVIDRLPLLLMIYHNNEIFIGHITNFSWEESAETPLINYSFTFTAVKRINSLFSNININSGSFKADTPVTSKNSSLA